MISIHLPMQETQVRSLGWEDPLEKEMATHSSILAWTIPWTEEPEGCSPWGHRESDATEHTHAHTHTHTCVCAHTQLIYNVVLVSHVQQSESVTYTHICTLSLDSFPI